MATLLQKKLAKAIVENTKKEKPLNKQDLLVSVGYSPITANVKSKEIMEQIGVKEELELLGFTANAAMLVVQEIMNNKQADPSARLKATDQVFKIHGSYAAEKSIVANVIVRDNEKQTKSKNIIDGLLSGIA